MLTCLPSPRSERHGQVDDHEARADALDDYIAAKLDAQVAARNSGKKYPMVAELESKVDSRGYRRGAHAVQTPLIRRGQPVFAHRVHHYTICSN